MKKVFIVVILILILGYLYRMYWPAFRPISSFSGTVELTEHSVGAHVAGRLTQLFVKEGDFVKKDQLLGTLDRFEQASRDYDRTLSLYKSGGTTHQSLEQAQLTLDDQKIVAPLDAVVLTKIRETGEMVVNGGAVLDLGDRNDMWIRIYVPEGQVSSLHMNQHAVIHIDGLKQAFDGHVSFIPPVAEFTPRNVQSPDERVTQTFAVKVALDNPPDFLRPGVSGDVTLKDE